MPGDTGWLGDIRYAPITCRMLLVWLLLYYGPFRDAADSVLVGDRRTYPVDPGNAREAMKK